MLTNVKLLSCGYFCLLDIPSCIPGVLSTEKKWKARYVMLVQKSSIRSNSGKQRRQDRKFRKYPTLKACQTACSVIYVNGVSNVNVSVSSKVDENTDTELKST